MGEDESVKGVRTGRRRSAAARLRRSRRGDPVDDGPAPRLLIVDDAELLLANLARAAAGRGFVAHTARDGDEAWRRLITHDYDVVVTDLRMPGTNGSELMNRISREGKRTRVVVITGYATLEAAIDCLRKGAVDFLIKPFEVETFLKSVEKALTRKLPGGEKGPPWDRLAENAGLTRRQAEILKRLYETGMTNRQLAEALCLSPHTVKSHLKSAFHKMGVSTRAQLFQKLREKK
jgi:DNA-binding NarL/FixJ family response regulator